MKLPILVVFLSVVVFVSSLESGNTQEKSASYSQDASQANYARIQRRTFGETFNSIISFIITMIKRMLLISSDTSRRSAAQRRSLGDIFEEIVAFIKTMIKRIFLITDASRRQFQEVRIQDDPNIDWSKISDEDKAYISTLPPFKPGCKNGKCSFYVDSLP